MQSQRPKAKREASAKIENDVAAFLANGGKIKPAQLQDNAWYRDKLNGKRKGSRGNNVQTTPPDQRRRASSGGVALSIHPENAIHNTRPAVATKDKRTQPDHIWRGRHGFEERISHPLRQ